MPDPLSESYSYPQNYLDQEAVQTTTPLDIYHAPFSTLHLESQPSNIDNHQITFCEANEKYYLPKTQEIEEEEFSRKLKDNIQRLPTIQQAIINYEYQQIHTNSQLYGEYLPQTYTKTPGEVNNTPINPGESIDPLKYVTNLMIERSLELQGKKQEIVLHPDIIFFASCGRIEDAPRVLKYLDSVAEVLGQKLFFENLSFSNNKFQEALKIFTDPQKIYQLIYQYPSLGLAIDIKHLETSEGNINIIGNIDPRRLIIHARQNYNQKYPDIYKYCISKAIPWIIE